MLSLENDSNYNICGCYHKPFASCRHTHGCAYAAIRAAENNNINWRDIEGIHVDMYAQGVNGHDHTEIPGAVSGKMSVPFCIALILVTGKIGVSSFTDETLNNQDILNLTKKVSVHADEEMTSWVPQKRVARVTVTLKNGQSFTEQVEYPLGEPELPMSIEDFCSKTTELALAAGRNESEVEKIIDMVLKFDGNVAEFMKILA